MEYPFIINAGDKVEFFERLMGIHISNNDYHYKTISLSTEIAIIKIRYLFNT